MTPHSISKMSAARSAGPLDALVGRSAAMQRLFRLVEEVAPTTLTVFITGETGTGKELVARAIHALSDRANRAFVVVNASAIPEALFESELFGHTRGSFTGAVVARKGLMEAARGGTLFIDEISTLTLQMQVKLLRAVEDRHVRRIGSDQAIASDFRLIVASNDDLPARIARREFREDLYYRLNVFPLEVPPLRERREDIPLLAEHFRRSFGVLHGLVPPPFWDGMVERLQQMEWKGNVRELEHFVQRAIVMRLREDDIRCVDPLRCFPPRTSMLKKAEKEEWSLARLEAEYIRSVLERTHGHRRQTAEILGVDRRTLYRKLAAGDSDSSEPEDQVGDGPMPPTLQLADSRVEAGDSHTSLASRSPSRPEIAAEAAVTRECKSGKLDAVARDRASRAVTPGRCIAELAVVLSLALAAACATTDRDPAMMDSAQAVAAASARDADRFVLTGDAGQWTSDITPSAIVFRRSVGARAESLRFDFHPPRSEGVQRIYTSVRMAADTHRIDIALSSVPCTDKNGRSYPERALVWLDQVKYDGCAARQ